MERQWVCAVRHPVWVEDGRQTCGPVRDAVGVVLVGGGGIGVLCFG